MLCNVLSGEFGSRVIWTEKKMESLNLLLVVAVEVLMHPFFHSASLLLEGEAGVDHRPLVRW